MVWNDTETPLAYFISFRSYGTWLHGDKRGSIDRFHNRYKSPYMAPSEIWRDYNQQHLRTWPLILKADHRRWIEAAIRETCNIRKWWLGAMYLLTMCTLWSRESESGVGSKRFQGECNAGVEAARTLV